MTNAEILEKLKNGYMLATHYGQCKLFHGELWPFKHWDELPSSQVKRSQIAELESRLILVFKKFNLKVWKLKD